MGYGAAITFQPLPFQKPVRPFPCAVSGQQEIEWLGLGGRNGTTARLLPSPRAVPGHHGAW
jgi:hypothetical protein